MLHLRNCLLIWCLLILKENFVIFLIIYRQILSPIMYLMSKNIIIGPTHIFKTVVYQCFDSSHQFCTIYTDTSYAIISLQQSQNICTTTVMLCVHFQNYQLLVLHSLLFLMWSTDFFLILGFLREDIQKRFCSCSRFAVMAYCWAMSADERPTFAQLHICLQEFYTQLTRYVWHEFIIVLLVTQKGTCRL